MKTSFLDLIRDNKMVIPIIQRDYAQGRTDFKTAKIRKDFLDVIFLTLKSRIENQSTINMELDFIYGFNTREQNERIFAPIDGQQRLTTLWLLHWFTALKEGIPESGIQMLNNFQYETRHSTTVFCQKLISFRPEFKYDNIKNEIKNQTWYLEAWDFDPSIRAMLVMLNDIEDRYALLDSENIWEVFCHSNSPFIFYKLDMESVGLADDLYIKMNSRGKPLTEFEYFKASFLDILENNNLRKRFENSIDNEWSECIWKIVHDSIKDDPEVDFAYLSDACFIRLLNYITDILAYKQRLPFTEVNHSIDELRAIYGIEENVNFLFDSLDAIVKLNIENPLFWGELFYIAKSDFHPKKARMFFQNSQINLLEKCLFFYEKRTSNFSFPEQLMLHACIIHVLKESTDFNVLVRVIRNLVTNSDNELRESTIGLSFSEIETFVQSHNFDILKNFKSDQIQEEKDKRLYKIENEHVSVAINELEDSDLQRGSISIFDLDNQLENRINKFLSIFDEDLVQTDFTNKSNLLLCFGDYSQNDKGKSNLLSSSKVIWRRLFTTPSFNKTELKEKTKVVLMACLDYFIVNTTITEAEKLVEMLESYNIVPKDWKYYFLKYPGFRQNVNKGYFHWLDDNYVLYKMKEKQFNGYYWDPFLIEIKNQIGAQYFELPNGGEMVLTVGEDVLKIKSHALGFSFENMNEPLPNEAIDGLFTNNTINGDGYFIIDQNEEGIDLVDRIQAIKVALNNVITSN